MTEPLSQPPPIVLDTNVVFDWLLFAEPSCTSLGNAVKTGELQWLATPAMRDEFFHVLGRGSLDAWQPDIGVLRSAWAKHCIFIDTVSVPGSAAHIRCTDTDDQMFIDLALGHRVRWLLSKDRAVLKLAGRMRAFGVEVTTPAAWASQRLPDSH